MSNLSAAERSIPKRCKDDLVSRKQVYKLKLESKNDWDFSQALMNMPSAGPKRKKGKWIPDEIAAYDMPKGEPRGWVPWLCSECGWCVGKHQTAFCPSCGSDMRGREEDGKTS